MKPRLHLRRADASPAPLTAKVQLRPFSDPDQSQAQPPNHDFSQVDLFSHAPQRQPIQAKFVMGQGQSQQEGNPAAVQSVTPAQSPQIQRLIMTYDQWIDMSAKVGKPRSALLLEIDGALAVYNGSHSESPQKRLALLNDLEEKINNWLESKTNEEGKLESSRLKAVRKLKERVWAEEDKLLDVHDAIAEPQSVEEVRAGINDLYERGVHELHAFLSKPPTGKNRDAVTGYWKRFRTEAMRVEHQAATLLDDNNAQTFNAHLSAQALREAMRAFRTISYRHLGSTRTDSTKTDLSQIRLRLAALIDSLRPTQKSTDAIFLAKVISEIDQFADLAGADKKSEAKLKALEGDEGVDFELIEEMLGAIDVSTTMMGFQGTGGKSNEGFSDLYKGAPEGTDDRTATQKGVEGAFNRLSPDTPKGQDIVSGVSDMENAFGGLESTTIATLKAWKTYKDPDASESDRLQAKLQLAQTPFSTIANTLKFVGGALTAHRGGENYTFGEGGVVSEGGKLAKSNFGFTANGTDVSTDVKMGGDFAALFGGIISTISSVIDLVKTIKDGGGSDPKAQKSTVRKDFEAVGNVLRKYTGAVSSLASNFKAAARLGYQIAGEGQQAASNAADVSNLGGVVPGLQLAVGIMQAIQHAYKLVRIGIRRMALTEKLDFLTGKSSIADLKQVEAIEFAHGALVKRTDRIGISLGHALAAIVAGGFNVSGVGLAPGMVISLSSSAMKLGQIGLRKGKQYGRDRKAKKRAKKDEQRIESGLRDKPESYQDWKHRKRLQAAKQGKWEQFKTAVDVKFTFNWDKTSENKESTNREVALEVLRMKDTDIYDALGVTDALAAEEDFGKQLKIVVDALKKRD